MNWSLSEYNLIVYGYGHPELEIFNKQNGSSRFEEGRLFEFTSSHLKTLYEENLSRLSELPTLVAAEISHNKESATPAFLTSIDRVHKRGEFIAFQFNHLHEISSEEIFESDYFDFDRFERNRTHWAIKEGNLLESYFKLLQDSYEDNHRTEALTAVLDDLASFEVKPNDYLEDLEPQHFIDNVLRGKIESLRVFCRTLGWVELEKLIQEMLPLQGNAIESLELIQSYIIPEARKLLSKTNTKEVPSSSDWVWQCIHPRVATLARPRFKDGYYGEAVEASYKEVNEAVKQIVRDVDGRELDGAGLMTTAFSINSPLIQLTELETKTDQDIQKGYMQIMAGAMTGIRNPVAHGNLSPPASEALHLIYLASLLMHKIDERKSPK